MSTFEFDNFKVYGAKPSNLLKYCQGNNVSKIFVEGFMMILFHSLFSFCTKSTKLNFDRSESYEQLVTTH